MTRNSKKVDEQAAARGEKHLQLQAKDLFEHEFLTICQLILRKNRSNALTPLEDFIMTLAYSYGRGHGGMTPEHVAHFFDEYKDQHEAIIESARYAVREYPEAFV